MLEIDIPGYKKLVFNNLVMDYNGTLAVDGYLIDGVQARLDRLLEKLSIYIITADTFGRVEDQIQNISYTDLVILSLDNQDNQKENFVKKLGAKHTIAIGNGRNDRLMLKLSELGIVTIQEEGASYQTIEAADIVVNNINNALDLLLNPMRLIADLRC